MLNREITSITNAVYQAWSRIDRIHGDAYNALVNDVESGFKKDLRIKGLADALEGIGYDNSDGLAWNLAMGNGFYGATRLTGRGLRQELTDAKKGVKNEAQGLLGDPDYVALTIALNTSKKKWPALQTDVYTFVADISAAKDYDELRTAIRKFTGTLA